MLRQLPFCIEDEPGAEVAPTVQGCSGVLISHVQHCDFCALKPPHLIGAIITPDEAQQVIFEMLAFSFLATEQHLVRIT